MSRVHRKCTADRPTSHPNDCCGMHFVNTTKSVVPLPFPSLPTGCSSSLISMLLCAMPSRRMGKSVAVVSDAGTPVREKKKKRKSEYPLKHHAFQFTIFAFLTVYRYVHSAISQRPLNRGLIHGVLHTVSLKCRL